MNMFCWLCMAQEHSFVNLRLMTLFKHCILCDAFTYSPEPVEVAPLFLAHMLTMTLQPATILRC